MRITSKEYLVLEYLKDNPFFNQGPLEKMFPKISGLKRAEAIDTYKSLLRRRWIAVRGGMARGEDDETIPCEHVTFTYEGNLAFGSKEAAKMRDMLREKQKA